MCSDFKNWFVSEWRNQAFAYTYNEVGQILKEHKIEILTIFFSTAKFLRNEFVLRSTLIKFVRKFCTYQFRDSRVCAENSFSELVMVGTHYYDGGDLKTWIYGKRLIFTLDILLTNRPLIATNMMATETFIICFIPPKIARTSSLRTWNKSEITNNVSITFKFVSNPQRSSVCPGLKYQLLHSGKPSGVFRLNSPRLLTIFPGFPSLTPENARIGIYRISFASDLLESD